MLQSAETAQDLYERMHAKLSRVVPEFELRYKAGIAFRINELKRARNAVILGHNYMEHLREQGLEKAPRGAEQTSVLV